MKLILPAFLFFTLAMPAHPAYLYSVRGEVYSRPGDGTEWKKLTEDDEKSSIKPGAEIKTSRASSVEIMMDDGSKVKIAPGSFFKLDSEDSKDVKLSLFGGRIRNWVRKFSKRFQVKTPTAVCAVRGTDFMVKADDDGNTRVEVYEGSVLTGDSKGREELVKRGEFVEVNRIGGVGKVVNNPNAPQSMDSSLGDRKLLARKEIYTEISKEDVIRRAQAEMQSAEYQNRKTAIDAFGNRVRMEEYIVRPADNQFKYVVLNTRENRFDFGKILFTFNASLPQDLTQATKNMLYSEGSSAPQWYLTDLNSVISNTSDKVTEDASGGKVIPDSVSNPSSWTHFFSNYGVYFAGTDEGAENGGLGRLLWKYSDSDNNNKADSGEYVFLGGRTVTGTEKISDYQTRYDFNDGASMLATRINPAGDSVFDNIVRNEYSDGTWINTRDFLLFDSGKIASSGDFSGGLNGSFKDMVSDRLNFERVYESSLFHGRKIDLEFSAKLLKDAGMLRF